MISIDDLTVVRPVELTCAGCLDYVPCPFDEAKDIGYCLHSGAFVHGNNYICAEK